MTYPFVAAKYFTAGAMEEPRAVVVHTAQGGGTVTWLSRSDGAQGNNSSHFVIEYSGRVVQMVKDADASHSLHIDRPYGPPGAGDYEIYSLDTAKAVLGTGISNPNAYIFAVEIEGYAASGPNDAQTSSLKALIADLRKRHPSLAGNLGHRDFQDYKACPGGHVPWLVLGGHGRYFQPSSTEADLPTPTSIVVQRWTANGTNGALRTEPNRALVPFKIPGGTEIISFGEWLDPATGNNWRRAAWPVGSRTEVWFLRAGPGLAADHDFIAGAFVPVPAPPVDCTTAVADATAALQVQVLRLEDKANLLATKIIAAQEALA